MLDATFVARQLAPGTEYDWQFTLADQAFAPEPSPESVREWQEFILALPDFRPEQLRGVFRDGVQASGCIIYERELRLGVARLLAGCIGMVVTHPDQRHTGAASALLADALAFAQARGHAMLLLDGIPRFYKQFGYADVFDLAYHDVNVAALLAQPAPENITLRPATMDDVAALRDIYARFFASSVGSFPRSIAQQQHRQAHRSPENPAWLAVAPDGTALGYMILGSGLGEPFIAEVAADDPLAGLALLRHAAEHLPADGATALHCMLPPEANLTCWLIDHLQDPAASQIGQVGETWAVRQETYHHHNAAWQARIANLDALARAMLPEWQALWRGSLTQWSGDLSFAIGDDAFTLRIAGDAVSLADVAPVAEPIRLTPQAFMQTVWGYRTIDWAANQPEQHVPPDVLPALRVLFPHRVPWIPRTDWF